MNSQQKPSNSWTSNISDKNIKEEFNSRLLSNKDLFQRLRELVEVMNKTNSDSRVKKTSYESPAWSEYQADANGYERACNELLNLLKFAKE